MWSDLEGQWVCIRGIAKSQPWPNQFQKTRILFNRLYGIIIIPVGGSHDIATGSSPFFVDMPTIGPSTSELLPMLLYVPAACLSIALVHKQVPRWCSTAQDRHTYTAVLVHISLSSEGLTTNASCQVHFLCPRVSCHHGAPICFEYSMEDIEAWISIIADLLILVVTGDDLLFGRNSFLLIPSANLPDSPLFLCVCYHCCLIDMFSLEFKFVLSMSDRKQPFFFCDAGPVEAVACSTLV